MLNWDSITPAVWDNSDGVVLSGSYDMLSEPRTRAKFSTEVELASLSQVPLLGVCFGHQLLGHAFGSKVVKAPHPSLGYCDVDVLRKDSLFAGLGPAVSVYESHHEVIDSLPGDFHRLAKSRGSEICAMQHSKLPLFGVQFHPERNSPERLDGERIIANFVRMAKTG